MIDLDNVDYRELAKALVDEEVTFDLTITTNAAELIRLESERGAMPMNDFLCALLNLGKAHMREEVQISSRVEIGTGITALTGGHLKEKVLSKIKPEPAP